MHKKERDLAGWFTESHSRKRWKLPRAKNRLSVMTALIAPPFVFFCTIFFVSHISYAFTTKVYKFHDFWWIISKLNFKECKVVNMRRSSCWPWPTPSLGAGQLSRPAPRVNFKECKVKTWDEAVVDCGLPPLSVSSNFLERHRERTLKSVK